MSIRHRQLDPDQRGLDAADHQEHERQGDVHDAQPLVVHCYDPFMDPVETRWLALVDIGSQRQLGGRHACLAQRSVTR